MPGILRQPIIYIFILALFLRVYRLGALPPGWHVDGVKVAWNAYSLFKTGRDDWGHPLPLHYDTFGDFRPTGIMYAVVPATAIWGPTADAARLPAAVLSALGVVAIFYLVKNKTWGIFSAFLLAVNSWHITLSRATSEATIALTLVMLGLVLFMKKRWLTAFLMLAASIFFYHSALVLTPIFTLVFLIRKPSKAGLVVSVLVGLLAAGMFINPAGRGRLNQVSIFNDLNLRDDSMRLPFEEGPNHVLLARILYNKPVLWTNLFINEYVQYFNPGFFITPLLPNPDRYTTVGVGLLSYAEFGLLLMGLVLAARGEIPGWIVVLLLLAPIPAAMTTEDVPNISRSVMMIPLVILIAAASVTYLPGIMKKGLVVILILEAMFFWHQYSVHNPNRYGIQVAQNVGVPELISAIENLRTKYEAVYLTNIPDSLYPWYAAFTKQDPQVFNAAAKNRLNGTWTFGNIGFTTLKCPSDYILDNHMNNVLAVDTEGCPDQAKKLTLIGKINRPGNTGTPYTLWAAK